MLPNPRVQPWVYRISFAHRSTGTSTTGFGAIGEAFKDGADDLVASEAKPKRSLAHLPTNFLYRQSVELYLTSMIVVIHRRLRLPFGHTPLSPCT